MCCAQHERRQKPQAPSRWSGLMMMRCAIISLAARLASSAESRLNTQHQPQPAHLHNAVVLLLQRFELLLEVVARPPRTCASSFCCSWCRSPPMATAKQRPAAKGRTRACRARWAARQPHPCTASRPWADRSAIGLASVVMSGWMPYADRQTTRRCDPCRSGSRPPAAARRSSRTARVRGEELLRERSHAALTLDRLNEYRRHRSKNFARRSATCQSAQIPRPGITRRERLAILLLVLVATAPMVRPWNCAPARGTSSQLSCPSLRSRPASRGTPASRTGPRLQSLIAEEDGPGHSSPSAASPAQAVCSWVEEVRGVQQLLRLLRNRLSTAGCA